MKKWICTDGNADVEIEADRAREAAQEYVDSGEWGDATETSWVTIYVTQADNNEADRQAFKIAIEPKEPSCTEDDHDWHETSMRGNDGGIIYTDKCKHCALVKTTNTWATDRNDGEQGLRSIQYPKESNHENERFH